MAVAVAVAVAVNGSGAVDVAVSVAGLTKRFLNHIQKDFLINVWGNLDVTMRTNNQTLSLKSYWLYPFESFVYMDFKCDRQRPGSFHFRVI